jgi:hypothetical protein
MPCSRGWPRGADALDRSMARPSPARYWSPHLGNPDSPWARASAEPGRGRRQGSPGAELLADAASSSARSTEPPGRHLSRGGGPIQACRQIRLQVLERLDSNRQS